MEWLVLVLTSVLLSGAGSAINRYILRDEHVISYGFVFTFISSVFFLPLMLTEEVVLPQTTEAWFTVFAAGVLWWVINIIGFSGVSKIDATLSKPLASTKILIVFVLSVLLLGETATAERIVGTILVMAGTIVITWKRTWFSHFRNEGVQLVLATAAITAVVNLLDKYNMAFVSANFYGFLMYFIPSVLLGLMTLSRVSELKRTVKSKWKAILVVTLCYGVAYYFILNAYTAADVNVIYPLLQLATLVTMGIAYFWLGEKVEFGQRVAGATLMIIGAALVTIGA